MFCASSDGVSAYQLSDNARIKDARVDRADSSMISSRYLSLKPIMGELMNTPPKRPNQHYHAKVIRELSIAEAKQLFALDDAQVVYIEKCAYRKAEFGGYFLAAIPPRAYHSGDLPKRYLRVYVKWFNWMPPTKGFCRVTLLADARVAPDYKGHVVTDIGLQRSDISRQQ